MLIWIFRSKGDSIVLFIVISYISDSTPLIMVQIYILLLTLGTMFCGPLTGGQEESSHLQAADDENLDTIVEGEVEDMKNGEEGIHLHAAAGDLNNFINVIQNKHPKDVRLGDEEVILKVRSI